MKHVPSTASWSVLVPKKQGARISTTSLTLSRKSSTKFTGLRFSVTQLMLTVVFVTTSPSRPVSSACKDKVEKMSNVRMLSLATTTAGVAASSQKGSCENLPVAKASTRMDLRLDLRLPQCLVSPVPSDLAVNADAKRKTRKSSCTLSKSSDWRLEHQKCPTCSEEGFDTISTTSNKKK